MRLWLCTGFRGIALINMNIEQRKSEGFDSGDQPCKLAQIMSKSIFHPLWHLILTDYIKEPHPCSQKLPPQTDRCTIHKAAWSQLKIFKGTFWHHRRNHLHKKWMLEFIVKSKIKAKSGCHSNIAIFIFHKSVLFHLNTKNDLRPVF